MSTTYEDRAHQDGYAPVDITPPAAPADVSFGKRDDDKMPHTWAERGLAWLHENRPNVFADMMLAVVGINAHTTTRGGK